MVVSFTVRSEALREKLRTASPDLRKFIHKRFKKKAKDLKLAARRVAPRNRGKLSRAIYGRAYKKDLRITVGINKTASNPETGYYYAPFLAGEVKITIAQPNRYFAVGQTIRYGSAARSPSGNQIMWSASPRWWEGVQKQMNRSVPQTAIRAIKDFEKDFNKK